MPPPSPTKSRPRSATSTRSEQEVLSRSTTQRMNNTDDHHGLFLNCPQAVGSLTENRSLEKNPKGKTSSQAALQRWPQTGKESTHAITTSGPVCSCSVEQALLHSSAGAGESGTPSCCSWGAQPCGGDERQALTSGLSPPTRGQTGGCWYSQAGSAYTNTPASCTQDAAGSSSACSSAPAGPRGADQSNEQHADPTAAAPAQCLLAAWPQVA